MVWIKKIRGQSDTVEKVAIYIYNEIDQYYGFGPKDLMDQLKDVPETTTIEVHINSPGGSVYDGLAIYNILRSWKGKVVTVTEGIAASMASVIFLAGSERIIYDNAQLMIHNPMTFAFGNSDEIEETLDQLKETEERIKGIYLDRTNVEKDTLDEMLTKDTFLDAEQSVELGFATKMLKVSKLAAYMDFSRKGTDMDFEKWLEGYCSPLGIDPKKLTNSQRASLKKRFEEETKKISEPSTPQNPVAHQTPDRGLIDAQRDMLAKETERVSAIRAFVQREAGTTLNDECVEKFGLTSNKIEALEAHAIREGWDLDKFELEVHRARFKPASNVAIHRGIDRNEIDVPAMSAALLMQTGIPYKAEQKWSKQKYGIEVWYDEPTLDKADKLGAVSLHQILDHVIWMDKGVRWSGNYRSDAFIRAVRESLWNIRAASNTTWTGLNVFDDAANKMLWAAYEAQDTTWQEWVPTISVSDFKTYNMYRMTFKGGYMKVGADGELKHGGFTDDKYTVAADTFGKIVGLTRRDIINDDLGALQRVMTGLGVEAARFLEELFYTHLLNQLNTLFPAAGTYNNYLSGATSALGVDSLSDAEELFSNQVDADGAPIMVRSELILTGTALQVQANELFNQVSLRVVQSANSKGRPDNNPHVGKWRPVTSPYLNNTQIKARTDAVVSVGSAIPNQSDTQWFLLPAPSNVLGGVLVGAFLNGQQRPTIEQSDQSFEVLGLQWRAYHDAGVGNGDPRLGVYSKGQV